MQLRVFHRLLLEHPEYTENDDQRIKLVLVGGSRNEGDARRVDGLRELAKELSIEVCPYIYSKIILFLFIYNHCVQSQVEFVVNASYPLVLEWLSKASIGLSTMVDEHFGINVVELMVWIGNPRFFFILKEPHTFRLLASSPWHMHQGVP
jgi:alpha-1,2-mannosyltransferase